MSKVRVYELAKELNISSKDMVNMLNALNLGVNSHMASIDAKKAEIAKNQILLARQKVLEKHKKIAEEKKNNDKFDKKNNYRKDERQFRDKNDNRGNKFSKNKFENQNSERSKNDFKKRDAKFEDKDANFNSEQRDSRNDRRNKNFSKNKDKYNNDSSGDSFLVLPDRNKTQNKKDKKNRDKMKEKLYEDDSIDFFEKTRKVDKKKKNKKKNDALDNENRVIDDIAIGDNIIVKDLAEAMNTPVNLVIGKLIQLGIMVSQNQSIDYDAAEIVAAEFGMKVKKELSDEEVLLDDFNLDFEDSEEDMVTRPPVVTVMGHVDHGKTSLLDAIRNAHVRIGEAGGITQHIGAYTVDINGREIVFLDTPGHEAFTSMRARGAQITDISILVVAADDGIMPQTIEAINHSKAAGVPIIVAINKIDKPQANLDRIKQQLMEYDLTPEDWGGSTICVPVSALKGEGISELLEMILLVSEVEELKANPNRRAVGTIVEAELDKGRGPVATVLIQKGTLHTGDELVSGVAYGRVRAMFNDKNQPIKEAGPSMPVVVLGLSEVAEAGDSIYACEDEKTARNIAETKRDMIRAKELTDKSQVSLDYLYDQIKAGELKDLNIIVKGDVRGSIEALSASLVKISNDEIKINIIHTGVGGITESDVMLATASKAIIIGFNVRPNLNAIELSKTNDVDIRTYKVIYEAIEDIQNAVKGMLKPDIKENILGRAEVRDTFKLPNNTIIAGIYVLDGKITRNSSIRVLRDDVVIFDGKIGSLKRFKDDVREVQTGYEAGLSIERFNDIKVGDYFEAYEMVEVYNG